MNNVRADFISSQFDIDKDKKITVQEFSSLLTEKNY